MKISAYDKNYNVILTNHLIENRKTSSRPRGYHYTKKDIKEILLTALSSDLTSFRDKGAIRLRYKDIDGYISFMVITLTTDTITVITILDTNHKHDDFVSYDEVPNKIDLVGKFIFERCYELKIAKQPPRGRLKKK